MHLADNITTETHYLLWQIIILSSSGGPYACWHNTMERTQSVANKINSLKFNGKMVNVYRMMHNHLSLQVSSLFQWFNSCYMYTYWTIAVDAVFFLCSYPLHTLCVFHVLYYYTPNWQVRLSLFSFHFDGDCFTEEIFTLYIFYILLANCFRPHIMWRTLS